MAEQEVCPQHAELAMFNDWNRFTGLVLFAVVALYFPATIAWWWRRRRHPVLARRSFGLMVFSAVGGAMQFVTTGIANYVGRDRIPCDLHLVFTYLLVPLGAGPVAVRLILFYNTAMFQRLVDEKDKSRETALGTFRKKSNLSSAKALFRLFFLRCCRVSSGNSSTTAQLAPADSKADDGGEFSVENPIEEQGARRESRSSSTGQALHFATTEAFGRFVEFIFIAIAAIIIIVFMADPDSPYGAKGCTGCYISGGDFRPVTVQTVIIFVVGLTMLFVLRKTADPMGILLELRLCYLVAILVVAGTALSIVDPGDLRSSGQFDWLYLVSLAILLLHTIQCPLQVLKTYKNPGFAPATSSRSLGSRRRFINASSKKVIANVEEDLTELDDVLSTLRGKRIFERYLATEFSIENMYFLDAVKQYKAEHASATVALVTARAADMYASFIREGGMLEINISSSVRRAVAAALGGASVAGNRMSTRPKPQIGIFDAAEAEVRTLLINDSFPRFQRSKVYKQWKSAMASSEPKPDADAV